MARVNSLRSENWEFVLYPDSSSYDFEALKAAICDYFCNGKWAYALHDLDENAYGELKKAHIHLYCHRDGQLDFQTIVAALPDMPKNDIQKVKRFRSAVRYLSHCDYPEKHQYDPSAIISNFDHMQFFGDSAESGKARMIFAYLVENNVVDVVEAGNYCFQNNLYSAWRSGYSFWRDVIRSNVTKSYKPPIHAEKCFVPSEEVLRVHEASRHD